MSEEGTVARCEMDSHADTCVAGPNFLVLEFSGEQCDVSPYTNDYQPITNISVVNAATAFTAESTGETVILHFNQVLWYGKRMKMSLINPNQLRHFGITVSDDPTDSTRPFGILNEHLNIPFQMDGTTVYFDTRMPTKWELENCKSIQNPDDLQHCMGSCERHDSKFHNNLRPTSDGGVEAANHIDTKCE
jgi:hypothetical protein